MNRISTRVGSLLLLASSLGAAAAHAADPDPVSTRYGAPVALGNGTVRSYVTLEEGRPVEIGVAMTEAAMDGLPRNGSGHHGLHMETHEYIVALPEGHGTPFTFVELNWNPFGHEPAGVYEGFAHFDFHFYTIGKAERDAIDPADPSFAAKADNLPDPRYIPAGNIMLAPPEAAPSVVAVPKMGVHWVDPRSHELQAMLGNPAGNHPFTTTFIHGTWDGQVHFWEPMITRTHLLEKRESIDPAVRDEVIAIPRPESYQVPGSYPAAYRIQWDEGSREYRVALTQLEPRS